MQRISFTVCCVLAALSCLLDSLSAQPKYSAWAVLRMHFYCNSAAYCSPCLKYTPATATMICMFISSVSSLGSSFAQHLSMSLKVAAVPMGNTSSIPAAKEYIHSVASVLRPWSSSASQMDCHRNSLRTKICASHTLMSELSYVFRDGLSGCAASPPDQGSG